MSIKNCILLPSSRSSPMHLSFTLVSPLLVTFLMLESRRQQQQQEDINKKMQTRELLRGAWDGQLAHKRQMVLPFPPCLPLLHPSLSPPLLSIHLTLILFSPFFSSSHFPTDPGGNYPKREASTDVTGLRSTGH